MNMITRHAHSSVHALRIALIVAAVTLVALVCCPVGTAQQPLAPGMARALPGLQPGDGLRLSFWRDPEMNGDYFVDETGTLTIPLLGARSVTGIPADQLKRDLIRELQAQLANQSVQVNLLTRVRILGAVHRPGLYHVDPTMMLGDAIALAGGATPNGTLNKIRVVRGDRLVIWLSAADPVYGDVRSGDQIIVPERSWISRNGGVVLGALISAVGLVVAQAAF
jgi:polysaccharide export outer membrane protein